IREGLRLTLLREADESLREDVLELGLAIEQLYPDIRAIRGEMDRKALGHADRGFFVQLIDPEGHLMWSSPSDRADLKTSAAAKMASSITDLPESSHVRTAQRTVA